MQLQLTNGGFTQIDKEDFDAVSRHSWFKTSHGYAATNLKQKAGNYKQISLHRFLAGKRGFEVDHINHDRLDNRRKNLRVCTLHENRMNQNKRVGTFSKYKGVTKFRNSWIARITFKNKQRHIGAFRTEREAALAYNHQASKCFGEFANLNCLA